MSQLKIKYQHGQKLLGGKRIRSNTHVLWSVTTCGLKWLLSNSRFDIFYPFRHYLKQK